MGESPKNLIANHNWKISLLEADEQIDSPPFSQLFTTAIGIKFNCSSLVSIFFFLGVHVRINEP